MPIYEYYCGTCHRIYQFFTTLPRTECSPDCPRCGCGDLQRRASIFSTPRRRGEGDEPEDPGILDESRMEEAMTRLFEDFDPGVDDEDPGQSARMIRRFVEASGLAMGPGLEEAVHRLESGEDVADLEGLMDPSGEGLRNLLRLRGSLLRSRRPPERDDTLYFLD